MSITSTIKSIKATIKNWWIITIIGVLFIALGIYVFQNPIESYSALSVIFAISILITGIFQASFAVANRKLIDGWGWQLALGILELAIGVVLLRDMEMTQAVFPLYVGFWLLFRAFALIGFSFELKAYYVLDWGYYLVFGISLAIISWFIILNPLFGGLTIVTWTGIALILVGIANIMLSLRLKKIKKKFVDLKDAFMDDIQKASDKVDKMVSDVKEAIEKEMESDEDSKPEDSKA